MTVGGVAGSDPGYRLAAVGRENVEDKRLDLLEQIFDPGSRRRRDLVQPGWRCLEIGAGRGSMAVWLAERVGPAGQVVATDGQLLFWTGDLSGKGQAQVLFYDANDSNWWLGTIAP